MLRNLLAVCLNFLCPYTTLDCTQSPSLLMPCVLQSTGREIFPFPLFSLYAPSNHSLFLRAKNVADIMTFVRVFALCVLPLQAQVVSLRCSL